MLFQMFLLFMFLKKIFFNKCIKCVQVVSCRLQMTESLLGKTAEEQGASEAIGDKLINKAVTVMDSMVALVDR